MKKELKVSITPNNEIPAFAGYLSGSVESPEIKIVVNIESMVNTAADKEADISFEEIFTTSVVHEILHAVQEMYKREFDEEEVEKVLFEASKILYSEG
jgi:translation initiation factor IF-2